MADKVKSVNIIGCCATRDIFGLHEADGGYLIKRYVQNVSPISAVTKSPLCRAMTLEDDVLFSDTKNFFRRCQKLELEKKVFDYIGEVKADYLVIDLAEFRRKLFYFPDNDSWFSENYYFKTLFDRYRVANLIPDKYEIIAPLDIDNKQCERLLSNYFSRLREIYNSNEIILVDIKAGGHHVIDDEKLCNAENETACIFNSRIMYAFEQAKKNIPGAHVIEFPSNVTINKRHRWGRNLLHFVNEYYDYALEAIDIVTCGDLSEHEEMEKLEVLKKEYEKILLDKYGAIRN